MFKGTASSKITKDNTAMLANLMRDIQKLEVYVGVPEAKAGRKGDKINNAQLVFIHTNGSPLRKIPKRPIIEPAIEDSKDAIAYELSEAATETLEGHKGDAKKHLSTAGMIGQNAARAWFTNPKNGWPQNAESTARRKFLKLKGQEKKDLQQAIDLGLVTEADLTNPLIDTGAMRKSIIYIVKEAS